MERVCQFLQLDFDELVLQSQMPQSPGRKRLAKGALGRISPNPLKWPDYFDSRTLRDLELIGGRTLEELGYDVKNTAGDRDPGWLRRRYWRAIDFLRVINDQRKSTRKYDSWKKLVQKVQFSMKEYRSKRY
jgi:signal recognition particle subunit SEC65